MKSRFLNSAIAIGMAAFMTPALGADPVMGLVDEILAEPSHLVAEWELNRWVALAIMVGIALCGAAIAIAQGISASAKKISVLLGATVSVLTGIGNVYLDFDHRQYRSLASQGRHALAEARARKAELAFVEASDKAGRELILQDIRKAANRVLEMPDRFKEKALASNDAPGEGFFVRVAHAQGAAGRAPDWITKPPRDDNNLYFVGYSDAREYAEARRLSSERAFEEAQTFLINEFEKAGQKSAANKESIAKYLTESARVVTTYSTFDEKRRVHFAYTLLSMSKKIAASDLKAYAAKTGTPPVPEIGRSIQTAVRTERDYLANRVQVYFNQANKAQRALTDQQYKEYEDARNLRRAGKPAEAAARLKALVSAQPDFYLGWYNLALAYDDARNIDAARQAYERAVALERQQNVGDASLYNSYGFFLYRNRHFPEAVTSLERALALAPDHPKAKSTLAATKSAMAR